MPPKKRKTLLAKASPAYFAAEYLTQRGEPLLVPPHQRRWYHILTNPPEGLTTYDKVAIFAARDSGKSTAIAFVYPLWRLARDPRTTICFVGEKLDLPKSRLARIKREIESNVRLQEDFNLRPSKTWSTEGLKLQLSGEQRGDEFEANVFCYGIQSGGTGWHMDLMIWDDIITTNNSLTAHMREQLALHVRTSVYPQVKPNGQLVVVGTPKYPDDLYSTFADFLHFKSKSEGWRCHFYPAYNPNKQNPKTIWPERYNYQAYQTIRKQFIEEEGVIGERLFNQEYLLQPHSPGGEEFKDEWLVFYDATNPPVNLDNHPTFIGVDPAVSQGQTETASYNAMVVATYTADSEKWWVREIVRDRTSYGELPERIFNLYHKYRQTCPIVQVGIEAVFWQTSLANYMGTKIPTTPIKYTDYGLGGINKDDRIRKMQPYFAHKRILLPKPESHPMTAVFVNKEYKPFPASTTKDMLDALHIALLFTPARDKAPPIFSWR